MKILWCIRWKKEIGTEHVMVDCNNKEIAKLREQLKSNIIEVSYQYTQFAIGNIINIHSLANYICTDYHFAIFLKKCFSPVKSPYTTRISVPPWSQSNWGINNHNGLNNSVVCCRCFYDIQINMLQCNRQLCTCVIHRPQPQKVYEQFRLPRLRLALILLFIILFLYC